LKALWKFSRQGFFYLVGGIVVVFWGGKVKVSFLYGGCATMKRSADCVSTLFRRSAPEQGAGLDTVTIKLPVEISAESVIIKDEV